MPRRAKLRTLAKWLGTVLTVLTIVAWIASVSRPGYKIRPCGRGIIIAEWGHSCFIQYFEAPPFNGRLVNLQTLLEDPLSFWGAWDAEYFQYSDNGTTKRGFGVAFPFWAPFVLGLVPTCLLWRFDHSASRRSRTGLCRTCGYDLAATAPAAPCPECGKGRAT